MWDSEARDPMDQDQNSCSVPTPRSPSSHSSSSSTWDVSTSESHVFQGTQDWKYGSLRAMIGRHILIDGVQHRRYDQIHLYIDPKITNTVVKHDCLYTVADWTFTPGERYDIKWTVFDHLFILPSVEFVENPSLDVDGIFGSDFIEEFNHFFFKAWPSGLVQPSRFCIANPLFHPVNVGKVLKIYTAVQVETSVVGIGVFFGPEAGLNTWAPYFDPEPDSNTLSVWEMSELVEFDALCTTLSAVSKVVNDGQYIRIEFYVSSQRLISFMQAMGISSEGAELVVYHFDQAMKFLDLRKSFAKQAKATETDCIHILPYANETSTKQAQRLAELGARCSLASYNTLKESRTFYFKFLSDGTVARVPKQLVKETFRTILEDYLKGATRAKGKSPALDATSRQLGQGGCFSQALYSNEPLGDKRNENDPSSPRKEIKGAQTVPWEENPHKESGLLTAKITERTNNSETRRAAYILPHLNLGGVATSETSLSTPDTVSSRKRLDAATQTEKSDLSHPDIAEDVTKASNILVENARVEAREIKENVIREAEDILENAHIDARIIRKFATDNTGIIEKEAVEVDTGMIERAKIISEAQHEAQMIEGKALHQAKKIIDNAIIRERNILIEADQRASHYIKTAIERAEEAALHQRKIAIGQVIQKERSILSEAEKIVADARNDGRRIISQAKIRAEKESLVKIAYAQGQADLKISTADQTMGQAEEARRKIEAERLAFEDQKRFEEDRASLVKRAEESGRGPGDMSAEAETGLEKAQNKANEIKEMNSDAKAEAEKIIENARRIEKEIYEKEKAVEKMKVDWEAEVRKAKAHADTELKRLKTNAEIDAKREITELKEKTRADMDAECERMKIDIEVAIRLQMENEAEEARASILDRAKHDAEQLIFKSKKQMEELEHKMEDLKRKTKEDCLNEMEKLEALMTAHKKKVRDARVTAGSVIRGARVQVDGILKTAQEGLDKVPIRGDVLGSALPMTPGRFFKMFLSDGTAAAPLSAGEFAKRLESSKANVTLGQLVNHNVEGAILFLQECQRQERLTHEIVLYVDERRDQRLKYKRGKRLLADSQG